MYCFNFGKMPSLHFENLHGVQVFLSHIKHNFTMKSFCNWCSCSIFFPVIKERKSGMCYIKILQTSVHLAIILQKKKKKDFWTRFIFTEILIFMILKLCEVELYNPQMSIQKEKNPCPQCFVADHLFIFPIVWFLFSCLHFSEGRRGFFFFLSYDLQLLLYLNDYSL